MHLYNLMATVHLPAELTRGCMLAGAKGDIPAVSGSAMVRRVQRNLRSAVPSSNGQRTSAEQSARLHGLPRSIYGNHGDGWTLLLTEAIATDASISPAAIGCEGCSDFCKTAFVLTVTHHSTQSCPVE